MVGMDIASAFSPLTLGHGQASCVGALSLSPSPGRHKACPYVAVSPPPRVSMRRHMVPDDGHIRRLDRRLIDKLTITHHQDTVRQGQEFVQVLTH